jgi:glucose/arabinose dehydrogenase
MEFSMNSRTALLPLCALALAAPLGAQSSRENAVAIDRVPVPPVDNFAVEQIGPPMASPWSLAFLPDGRFLISEKHGGVRILSRDGRASGPLPGGPPNVLRKSDSGLLDIVLDPDFTANRLVYLAFAEGTEESNRTAIWKARLDGDRLTGGRVIFRVSEAKKDTAHPGGRMLFLPDKSLLLTVGDGFDFKDQAQNPASHLGKILRLTRDGAAAPDNPFVGRRGYAPEIWTLGHRNIQGLTRDPVTGIIWSNEHGPRGGDEINELVAGRNYGWPRASFGIDYDGKLITDRQHIDGLTDPRFFWAPSIAPSGLAIYRGDAHPEWDGKLFSGALAARSLVQLRIGKQTGLLVEEGRWLLGLKARIRDVRVSPDGQMYLLTDGDQGRLLRLMAGDEASLPPSSPLAPMAWLVGRWKGVSKFVPAFQTERFSEETSQIDCLPAFKATYIRCSVRLYRVRDGRFRMTEKNINKVPGKAGFSVIHFDSNWHGRAEYTLQWDEAEKAWVGLLPTEHDGRPATERIVEVPSADGKSVLHTESIRLDATPAAPWTETFRWTWTKI